MKRLIGFIAAIITGTLFSLMWQTCYSDDASDIMYWCNTKAKYVYVSACDRFSEYPDTGVFTGNISVDDPVGKYLENQHFWQGGYYYLAVKDGSVAQCYWAKD
ncbi:MAG: hypothetical protein NC078_10375, partial [Ruminococcus sp.]|nr:hypothetical protein [Ruminococcus sp.]